MNDPETRSEVPPADLELAHRALDWTREAGELTLEFFRHPELDVRTKDDGTPVTHADHDAEALLRSRIAEAFPDDAVSGEEHEERPGSSGHSWVIDPIDGTKAFSHGVATYSNLLQFSDAHGPAVGIINLPALGEYVWAARGHGAFWNEDPISLPDRGDDGLDGRILCVSGFHEWDTEMFARVQAAGVLVRTWGDAYGYALVATGRVDAMFDPLLEWWDLAAVQIVIEEAGAIITRRDGGPEVAVPGRSGPYGLSAIATNRGSHDDWVRLLSGR